MTKETKKSWVLLRMDVEFKDPGKEVFILVRGHTDNDNVMEAINSMQYWFDEGTCPTNYLGVQLIAETRDDGTVNFDPHGIFSYWSHCTSEEAEEIFKANPSKTSPGHPNLEALTEHLRSTSLHTIAGF